jgi:prepilin-type N-terminal cleavage/methylation domain-containing protein
MKHPHRGFTLIEVAISMVILGLVLTGLVVSLSSQLQQRRLLDTRTTLAEANDAFTDRTMRSSSRSKVLVRFGLRVVRVFRLR